MADSGISTTTGNLYPDLSEIADDTKDSLGEWVLCDHDHICKKEIQKSGLQVVSTENAVSFGRNLLNTAATGVVSGAARVAGTKIVSDGLSVIGVNAASTTGTTIAGVATTLGGYAVLGPVGLGTLALLGGAYFVGSKWWYEDKRSDCANSNTGCRFSALNIKTGTDGIDSLDVSNMCSECRRKICDKKS